MPSSSEMKDKYGITVLHDPTSTNAAPRPGQDSTQSRVVFDLVAIHGLNGDPMDTWTHKKSGVMWLKDLLPKALPCLRIMTFGYDARFKSFTAQQDLRAISSKLLVELVDLRITEEEKSRPIILVCHSLGGIVAKKALLIGCLEEEEKVQQSVYGILFLGTPHNGSGLASMGKLISNIVLACLPMTSIPRAFMGILQKSSDVLMEISVDFVKRRRKIRLVSFYELKLTPIIGPFYKKLIVEHKSAILRIAEEATIAQYADHRDIARFDSLEDRSFRSVVSKLRALVESLEDAAIPARDDATIPLHLNTLPCSSFLGRDDVLDSLNAYFFGDKKQSRIRRTFAICGLGGSGKTQTALHWIMRNAHQYRTGVMLLNATSAASLIADFDRLHEDLRLPESNNKVNTVKKWLSKPENTGWLMVFDNADDLDSVTIQAYLPIVNWGHVLITTRNQAAIGGVTDDGLVLNPLATDQAMELLLKRSGIHNANEKEVEEAKAVALLLGSLPLALVQAGAFVRSRHRTLEEYHRLYLTHQHGLLSFSARFGNTDKAVLTAWEINFKQIEHDSPNAASILLLFSFLEPSSIPEMLLHRGTSPQKRWNNDGEVMDVPAEKEGVDSSLIRAITDELEFDAAVERLLSFSLITCKKESTGRRVFSIHPLVQYCAAQRLSPAAVNKWRWQAILLVCHAFPRSRYIDPVSGGKDSRIMLPHLNRILFEYDSMCIEQKEPTPFRSELASVVLEASRFSIQRWKFEAMDRARKLLEDHEDHFLDAWFAYRESAILRMSGKVQESEHALQSFIQRSAIPNDDRHTEVTPRSNAQRGELIISFSENLIRQGNLDEAKAELMGWNPLDINDSSTLENITRRARDLTLGKVLRYQGMFKEALELLEPVLHNGLRDKSFNGTGWYRVLLSEVAGLYCELARADDAEVLLLQELDLMRKVGVEDGSEGKRLQLSLVETYLQRNMYTEAESLLAHLGEISVSRTSNYKAQIYSFHIQISLARVYHRRCRWEEALAHWRHALSAAKLLKPDGGFNTGLVQCSIAHALRMMGHESESTAILEEGKLNLASEPRVYWISTFNSAWHDFIVESLKMT